MMIDKPEPMRDYQIGQMVMTLNALNEVVSGIITGKTIYEYEYEIRVLYKIRLSDTSVKAVYVTPYRDDVSCE